MPAELCKGDAPALASPGLAGVREVPRALDTCPSGSLDPRPSGSPGHHHSWCQVPQSIVGPTMVKGSAGASGKAVAAEKPSGSPQGLGGCTPRPPLPGAPATGAGGLKLQLIQNRTEIKIPFSVNIKPQCSARRDVLLQPFQKVRVRC